MKIGDTVKLREYITHEIPSNHILNQIKGKRLRIEDRYDDSMDENPFKGFLVKIIETDEYIDWWFDERDLILVGADIPT